MARVRLELTPAPAQVRTARLVAAAVARRCGVDDSLLDEIRLAVGEACSWAVAQHRAHGSGGLVRLEMEDGGPFTVEVFDAEPPAEGRSGSDPEGPGPATSGPGTSGPGTSGPGTSGPGTSGPGTSGPGTSGPGTSGPGTSGPATSRPGTSGPATWGPGTSGPATSGRGTSGPGGTEADVDQPEDDLAGAGLALLASLVEDVQVRPGPVGRGPAVRMSWPVAAGPRQR